MQPDANRIQHDIHDLRDQAATLDALATRRIKIHHDTAHGRMSSAPTPLNLPAQDLLDQIHALALRLAYAAGLRFGRGMDVHGLLKGIDRPEPCEVLAARGDAWGIVRLVDDAAWRARQLTDPSPSLRYAGICPRCRSGVWIPETQPLTTEYRCTECGHVEPLATITQAHELRLLTSGTMDTAANLCHLLCACGIHVKRNTITQWRKRKRITPVGKDEQGRPVYALADVLLLRRAVDR
ncbi:hypothetical protein AALA26_01965 [Bifidobacterium pseudolongum]|uniref:PhnA protein n=2 Tax=Bifidobacterium pseudolongum TaxID=1694 RepID=A0AB37NZA8_9BIFI|nr:hypothetical protein [Bifidobacterium pseudolongum]MCH4842785.1 hypothetical protein [Bifidobacterium pseudolongum]NBH69558.1 hypothetical protein [Bifidobacterium pseudolongum]RKI88819.1 hypothetical protein D7V89_00170 [Bifidobacterium pseudolongum]RKI88865.1 hypothetical protein D7V89_00415 [Bifidobacterium pseudolongum]RYQ68353.1 PhnA protein [Bifidobacterium pseudolongum subsp. globosum]